jgi:flavin reductase (DIM6/NTAB) family NADH-FMN oxidoreductase RutF
MTLRQFALSTEAVAPDEFRRALSQFASGITVVTINDGGALNGATVSAFSSLSLDPPLVLLCLSLGAASAAQIRRSGRFAVNILGSDSEPISRRFAGQAGDKFAGVGYRLGANGAPLLDDALTTLECELAAEYPGGDHAIFVGAVKAVQVRQTDAPLLYYRGRYRKLQS